MTVATDPRKTGIAGGVTLLAASAVAASVTGTTNETTLLTVPIPAGAMGLNGGVRVHASISYTNSANNKTLKLKLGGTALRTVTRSAGVADAINDTIRNRGSASAQHVQLILFASGAISTSQTTGAVDTSVAQDVTLTAQLALGSETFTLESYEVWLLQ